MPPKAQHDPTAPAKDMPPPLPVADPATMADLVKNLQAAEQNDVNARQAVADATALLKSTDEQLSGADTMLGTAAAALPSPFFSIQADGTALLYQTDGHGGVAVTRVVPDNTPIPGKAATGPAEPPPAGEPPTTAPPPTEPSPATPGPSTAPDAGTTPTSGGGGQTIEGLLP